MDFEDELVVAFVQRAHRYLKGKEGFRFDLSKRTVSKVITSVAQMYLLGAAEFEAKCQAITSVFQGS